MTNEIQKARFDYNTLDRDKARGLRSQATAIKAAIKRTQNDIIEIGNRLIDVRNDLEHGQFMTWVSFEFGMSQTSAWNFMRVSETFGKFSTVENLPFHQGALYALSAPSVSDETREFAIEYAETGETVTKAVAKEIITAHQPIKTLDVAPESSTRTESSTPKEVTPEETERPFFMGDTVEWLDGQANPHSGIYRGIDPDTNDAIVDECDGDEDLVLEPPVAALRLVSTASNSESQNQTHIEIDDAETQAEADRDDDIGPNDIDGYGRPIAASQSTPPNTTASTPTVANTEAPKLTIEQRIAQLPLALALDNYGHHGHIFRQQAAIWYERQGLMRSAHAVLSAVRYTTGPVTDAIRTLANIPDPALWTGCAACKGSLRVGERSDPCQSCRGGFTTYVDEGVSADAVTDHAANMATGNQAL